MSSFVGSFLGEGAGRGKIVRETPPYTLPPRAAEALAEEQGRESHGPSSKKTSSEHLW